MARGKKADDPMPNPGPDPVSYIISSESHPKGKGR